MLDGQKPSTPTKEPRTPQKAREGDASLAASFDQVGLGTPKKVKEKVQQAMDVLKKNVSDPNRLATYREFITRAVKADLTARLQHEVKQQRSPLPRVDALARVSSDIHHDFGFLPAYLFPQTQVAEEAAHQVLQHMFTTPELFSALVDDHGHKFDIERKGAFKRKPLIRWCASMLAKGGQAKHIDNLVENWCAQDYRFLTKLDLETLELVSQIYHTQANTAPLINRLQHLCTQDGKVDLDKVSAIAQLVRAWVISSKIICARNISIVPADANSSKGENKKVIYVAVSSNPDASVSPANQYFHELFSKQLTGHKLSIGDHEYQVQYIPRYHEEYDELLSVLNEIVVKNGQDHYARIEGGGDTYTLKADKHSPDEPRKSCSEKKLTLELSKLIADGNTLNILGCANVKLPDSLQLDYAKIEAMNAQLRHYQYRLPQVAPAGALEESASSSSSATPSKKSKTMTAPACEQDLPQFLSKAMAYLEQAKMIADIRNINGGVAFNKPVLLHAYIASCYQNQIQSTEKGIPQLWDTATKELVQDLLQTKTEGYTLTETYFKDINSAKVLADLKKCQEPVILANIHSVLFSHYVSLKSMNVDESILSTLHSIMDVCISSLHNSSLFTPANRAQFYAIKRLDDEKFLVGGLQPRKRALPAQRDTHSPESRFNLSVNQRRFDFNFVPCCQHCEKQNFAYRYLISLMRSMNSDPDLEISGRAVFGSPAATSLSSPTSGRANKYRRAAPQGGDSTKTQKALHFSGEHEVNTQVKEHYLPEAIFGTHHSSGSDDLEPGDKNKEKQHNKL